MSASTPVPATGPWWSGRLVGAALVLTLGFVGWASVAEPTVEPVSPSTSAAGAVDLSYAAAPLSAGSTASVEDSWSEPSVPASAATARAARRAGKAEAEARARSEAAGERRERARARRAARADRELAAFVTAVAAARASAREMAAAAPAPSLASSSGTVPAGGSLWTAPLRALYRITATFGQAGARWSRDHTGVDLAAPTGTTVGAVAAGTVTHAGTAGAYGQKVELTHADGTETWYAHLSRIDVAEGQVVATGQTIGAVGATGNVTGPHLHLEVRPRGGGPIDPVRALAVHGVVLR